ncbi:cyd operon YbgE family protein [Methylophaga sulfidovorans]|uniref:Cyd operon protein YbgE n=1 Tax=Methylophaga sulfidovorans TaxID=45496 RepID=A0A1I3TYS1_9GAMM|nr:cyd operon YbgE family protein [Methylophaga sulfidovorans]SFJ75885.1 cyd operon protein YbgE [Methylophaga sulfidovorans]
MTNSWIDKSIVRLISLLTAIGLSTAILIFPNRLLMENGKSDHDLLMLLLVGVCIGFIHGVGFSPKKPLWHNLLSPYICWPIMFYGCFHMAVN